MNCQKSWIGTNIELNLSRWTAFFTDIEVSIPVVGWILSNQGWIGFNWNWTYQLNWWKARCGFFAYWQNVKNITLTISLPKSIGKKRKIWQKKKGFCGIRCWKKIRKGEEVGWNPLIPQSTNLFGSKMNSESPKYVLTPYPWLIAIIL